MSCVDVSGATGKTYGVRLADLGYRLRVAVRATNARGSGTATSGLTTIVAPTSRRRGSAVTGATRSCSARATNRA
jgi:hypothetical protein